MLGDVALDRLRVRCAVLIAQVEHLVGDGAVAGPIGDDAEHRPRDAAGVAYFGDRGGFHVERHNAFGAQPHEVVGIGREPVGRPHSSGGRALGERHGTELAAGLAVHDDLGKDQRADRRLVFERAGDPDHEDPTHRNRVEQCGHAGGREHGAHPGDDRDHVATVEPSFVDGDAVDLRFAERKRAREGLELEWHREDEGDPTFRCGCVHRRSLPDVSCGSQMRMVV